MLTYIETLEEVSPHRIRCGKKAGGYTSQFWADEAEYVTEISGVITVTSDGSTYSIECSREPGCG